MVQYIPKSALVAEIERILLIHTKRYDELTKHEVWITAKEIEHRIQGLKEALSIINSLEVKGVDLEKDVRQILSLYYEGIKHYDDIIKEEREENGGSDLAIKIMDGVVDARELGIQYVIDKLKAQKGE